MIAIRIVVAFAIAILVLAAGPMSTSSPTTSPARELYRKQISPTESFVLLQENRPRDALKDPENVRIYFVLYLQKGDGARRVLWQDWIRDEGAWDQPEILDVAIEGDVTVIVYNRLHKCFAGAVIGIQENVPVTVPKSLWPPLSDAAKSGQISGSFKGGTLHVTLVDQAESRRGFDLNRQGDEAVWVRSN